MRDIWHREDFGEHTETEAFHTQAREVAELAGVRILAVVEEGRPTGFAQVETHDGASEVAQVFVRPERRGAGLGTELTARAILAGAGARLVDLGPRSPLGQRSGDMRGIDRIHRRKPLRRQAAQRRWRRSPASSIAAAPFLIGREHTGQTGSRIRIGTAAASMVKIPGLPNSASSSRGWTPPGGVDVS